MKNPLPRNLGVTLLTIVKRRVPDLSRMQKLLAAGADPDMRDEDESTALLIAAERGFFDLARVLIGAGAAIDAQDKYLGHTPLMAAISEEHLDIACFLLDRGADINLRSHPLLAAEPHSSDSALSLAIGRIHSPSGYADIIKALVARKADLEGLYYKGDTLLMQAARYGSCEAVAILLNAGADPERRNSLGESALDIARHPPESIFGKPGSALLIERVIKMLDDARLQRQFDAAQSRVQGMPLTQTLRLRKPPALKKVII